MHTNAGTWRISCAGIPSVSINSNLVDKWPRDNRHAPTPDADVAELEVSTSLLVEIKSVVSSPTSQFPISPWAQSAPLSAHRVDISLADGRRLLGEGATALLAVLALVEGSMV